MTYSSSSYVVFDDRKPWLEALASCREIGAELVKIESQNEREFIDATFLSTRKKIWIGLTDVQKEGVWKWSDGTSLQGYSNWGPGEPNNYDQSQHCVAVVKGIMTNDYFNAEWNDLICQNAHFYLCENETIFHAG